jgi:hypothetical protein
MLRQLIGQRRDSTGRQPRALERVNDMTHAPGAYKAGRRRRLATAPSSAILYNGLSNNKEIGSTNVPQGSV